MKAAYISHPSSLDHEMGAHHPECPERSTAIADRLLLRGTLDFVQAFDAPAASEEQIIRAHTARHFAEMRAAVPASGLHHVDPDTAMNPHTFTAALHAAGAGVLAVELVMRGEVDRAFCNVRPPGHHAERDHAMGFCFFNNVAIATRHALETFGIDRVAVIDFDVHHGNGTEDILAGDERVLMVSSFQSGLYPFNGEIAKGRNMCNVPLPAYSDGRALRAAVDERWIPALLSFDPQLIVVSAGFDAHRDDDMSQMGWADEDYEWLTRRIVGIAEACCDGRVVSMLEGGYAIPALARCVETHVRVLAGLD
ncbi:MAG: histone deacetylase family protein [Burkholderiaceae bacterium]